MNMGEGKTRVILPMLVLALGCRPQRQLVRLNFLDGLLADTLAHMHAVLTGARFQPYNERIRSKNTHARCIRGVLNTDSTAAALETSISKHAGNLLNVPVFQMPFNRDVRVTDTRIASLHMHLRRCVAAGGCFCIAREHRASLLNKQQVRAPPPLRCRWRVLLRRPRAPRVAPQQAAGARTAPLSLTSSSSSVQQIAGALLRWVNWCSWQASWTRVLRRALQKLSRIS